MDLTLSWERVSGGLNALDITIDVWKILIYEKAVLRCVMWLTVECAVFEAIDGSLQHTFISRLSTSEAGQLIQRVVWFGSTTTEQHARGVRLF